MEWTKTWAYLYYEDFMNKYKWHPFFFHYAIVELCDVDPELVSWLGFKDKEEHDYFFMYQMGGEL
jgi:hypothetical protein